jgi:hypothetical protein
MRRVRLQRSVRALVVCAAAWLVGCVAMTPAAAFGAQGPPPVGSEAPGPCSQDVTFALIQATTTGCLEQVSPEQWQTSDAIKLNGVPLVPVLGTKLILTGPSTASPGGQLSVRTDLTVAGVTFKRGLIDWNLPAGNKGDEKPVVSTGTLSGQKLFGFAISGSAEIRIGWDAGSNLRYFKFIGNLDLPSIFKNGPEQGAGGLTATVGLRVDRAGVHADSVKAQVSNAYIGALQVKNLCLSYTSAGSTTTPCSPPLFGAQPLLTCQSPGNVSRWDGSAEIVLPTADRPSIGVWAGVQNGIFSYAGGQATHLGSSVPIAQGIFLDNVGLAVCVTPPPMAFKGAAGINFGPTVNGTSSLTINGSLQYTDTRPWVIEARGNVQVFGRQVADGLLRYKSDNTIDFGFNANFDFKVASVQGSVAGWIEARNPPRFNVVGNGKVCVASVACSSGEVTVSSIGAAGCFTLADFPYPVVVKDKDWVFYKPWKVHTEIRHKRIRGGVGYRWSGGSPSVMGDSCDIGPYQAARSARAAAGAGGFTVSVSARTPALVLQARGRSAPPKVELIAPNGTRYLSPRAKAVIVPGHEVFAEDSLNSTTAIVIANPPAGTWTVRAMPGSDVTGLLRAGASVPPTILAGVGGHAMARVLGYSHQPDLDHTTRFVEEGASYEKELGDAAGRPCPGTEADNPRPLCGEIHFTPDAGPAGARMIYAITTMNGEITAKQLVASYDAPPEPEPSAVPSLVAKRVGDQVRISWTGSRAPIMAALPVRYDVDIDLSDGQRLLEVVATTDHTVTVPNVDPQTAIQVGVSALRSDDTQGATSRVTLAAGSSTVSTRSRA